MIFKRKTVTWKGNDNRVEKNLLNWRSNKSQKNIVNKTLRWEWFDIAPKIVLKVIANEIVLKVVLKTQKYYKWLDPTYKEIFIFPSKRNILYIEFEGRDGNGAGFFRYPPHPAPPRP